MCEWQTNRPAPYVTPPPASPSTAYGGDNLTALAATGQPFFEFAEGSWVRPGSTGPIVRFQIICPNGYPEINEIQVIRSEDDPEITPTTLQSIPLQKIKEDIYRDARLDGLRRSASDHSRG